MEVVATARWVRTTPRKARLVAATVQGLPVSEALAILSFTPRAAATDVAKVIKSAAANAEHNYNLDASSLRVARIEIEGASIIKRFRPRAQGRAFSVFKRTAHLRAFVSDEAPAAEPRRRRTVVEAEPEAPRTRRRAATPAGSARSARGTAPARARSARKPAAEPAPVETETETETVE